MAEPYEIRIKVTGEGAPQVKMIKRDLEGVKRAATGVDRKFAAANRQTKALAGNMRRASTQARGMGLNIKKAMGYFGIAAGGYMVVRQIKDASGAAMQLEKDLANVNTLLGRSHPMYGQYREDILKLKRIVPVLEIQDLTAGLYQSISAGVDAAGAMDATTAMAKAAAGGQAELGTVVKGTTTLMNAYSIAAKNATLATDYGLKTVKLAKLEYPEYAEGISMVAGTAATAKVSLKDLHAAIAIATRVQRPEQAFTGIRAAILGLSTRRKELKKLGIEYTTFADTIRQIKEFAPTPEEWDKILPEVRGAETLKAIVLGYGDFTNALKEFDNVAGTTMENFNIQQEQTYWKMAQNKGVLDEYKLALGKGLNEALIAATSGIKEFNQAADGVAPDTSGIVAFTDELTNLAGQAHTVYSFMKGITDFQKKTLKPFTTAGAWDPTGEFKGLGLYGGGKTEAIPMGPRPATKAAVTAAVKGAGGFGPRTAAEEAALLKPSARTGDEAGGGGGVGTRGARGVTIYQTIEHVDIKAGNIDKDSLLKATREIIKTEIP